MKKYLYFFLLFFLYGSSLHFSQDLVYQNKDYHFQNILHINDFTFDTNKPQTVKFKSFSSKNWFFYATITKESIKSKGKKNEFFFWLVDEVSKVDQLTEGKSGTDPSKKDNEYVLKISGNEILYFIEGNHNQSLKIPEENLSLRIMKSEGFLYVEKLNQQNEYEFLFVKEGLDNFTENLHIEIDITPGEEKKKIIIENIYRGEVKDSTNQEEQIEVNELYNKLSSISELMPSLSQYEKILTQLSSESIQEKTKEINLAMNLIEHYNKVLLEKGGKESPEGGEEMNLIEKLREVATEYQEFYKESGKESTLEMIKSLDENQKQLNSTMQLVYKSIKENLYRLGTQSEEMKSRGTLERVVFGMAIGSLIFLIYLYSTISSEKNIKVSEGNNLEII